MTKEMLPIDDDDDDDDSWLYNEGEERPYRVIKPDSTPVPKKPKKRKPPEGDEVDRAGYAAIFGGGNFFLVQRNIMHFLRDSEVLLLAHLCNVAEMNDAENNGGWFYHMSADMTEYLDWTIDKQTRMIKSLEEKGLIRTERRGFPSRRFISINYHRLIRGIGKVEKDRKKRRKSR
jgi:hypothetical protein